MAEYQYGVAYPIFITPMITRPDYIDCDSLEEAQDRLHDLQRPSNRGKYQTAYIVKRELGEWGEA